MHSEFKYNIILGSVVKTNETPFREGGGVVRWQLGKCQIMQSEQIYKNCYEGFYFSDSSLHADRWPHSQ